MSLDLETPQSVASDALAGGRGARGRRVPQLIADQLRALIQEGKCGPGERLASERRLVAQYGVSRPTAREALRILEARGLIEIRAGGHGGAFVRRIDVDTAVKKIHQLLAVSSLTTSDLAEVCGALEAAIMPVVCAHATEDEVAALSEMCARHERAAAEGRAGAGDGLLFHASLPAMTHNQVLETLVRALWMQRAEAAGGASPAPRADYCSPAGHQAVVAAIERADVSEAIRLIINCTRRYDTTETPAFGIDTRSETVQNMA
ncbi:FadR/GntR family transcriptional regulator [Streptomyces sp. 8L]|uniref:FadR/GntR family transcriptional regulator n=1 Tax=Streptomyces sp. 8L TaxID=2877242 RepID=UPI001CD2700F|nr:GntR family transcriptional regulator [Streptomyces sp. 8L]MCA1217855.1 GntR family transcriptional regulator [Streptomyces sp. 8L]